MLWIGSGRFDGRIGDGNGPRACRGPNAGIGPSAEADGTVRQLAWGTRVVKPLEVAHRVPWIGSGRFDGRIGDGNGPRACRGPNAGIGPSAEADGTVRQLAWGARVVRPPLSRRTVGPMPASRPTGTSGLGCALEWRNLRLKRDGHTATTASHCKGPRRYHYLSRCCRSHSRSLLRRTCPRSTPQDAH